MACELQGSNRGPGQGTYTSKLRLFTEAWCWRGGCERYLEGNGGQQPVKG